MKRFRIMPSMMAALALAAAVLLASATREAKGAPLQAFPAIAGTDSSQSPRDQPVVVELPLGIVPGDRLLVEIAAATSGGNDLGPPPAGWTQVVQVVGTFNVTALYTRVADGSEGISVTMPWTHHEPTKHWSARITGADPAPTAISTSSDTSTTQTPNPLPHTPSWGEADTLWIAWLGLRDTTPLTSYPPSYTHYHFFETTSGLQGSGASIGIAARQLRAASEDPGPFTFSAQAGNSSRGTLAIQPSGTGGPPSGGDQSTGSCGGAGTHANTGTDCNGEPVNTFTGAYTTQIIDLRLPGIGVPFKWRRSYTSADTTVGVLGPGWTHTYAASLAVQGNGDVILRGDEGQRVYYTRQGDGSFIGAPGALSVLTQIAGGYKLVRRDQVVYLFDTQGRLTSMKDRNNQGLTLSYNGSGQLQTITDSVGRQIAVAFASGLLSRVTLPDARYVEYSYTAGRLSSVRDARGGTTLYTYDAGGRLKAIVDQNSHTMVDNTYGADGRVTHQVNARGKLGTFAWNAGTQTSTYTDARLNQWKDVYAGNFLVKRIDPLGNETLFEHDAGLNVKKVTDARGNATTMTYDSRANMLTRTAPAPLSYQEIWTYNLFNGPLTYRDGRGNVTDFGYDAAGNLTSVTAPDPDGPGPLGRPLTLYGRDPGGTGLLTSITDPRGKQTTFTYTSGNLTEIRSQLQNRTTLGYDGSGRLTSLVDPRGNASGANPADFTWAYAYDELDHLRTQTDPLGNVTTLVYDPAGNLTTRADANAHVTSYGYDERNSVTSVTAPDPDGAGPLAAPVTLYTFDDVGNLATRRDANLHDTLYEYDTANRLTRVTAPLSRVWTYGYDPNGNVTQMVDANGNATPAPGDGQTTYGYDVLDRLASIDYSDTTPDVSFAYDGNDNRTQMTDGSGTETYAYDALDRLTSVTRGTDTLSYGHDLVNLTQRTYPGAVSTSYTYDDDNRLATAVDASLTTTYGYDAAGNLTSTTLPSANGHVETRLYDRAGRLTEVKNVRLPSTVRSRFVITPDPVGNSLSIVRTGSLAQTQTYVYDAMDRLTSVCFQSGTCPGASDPFIRWSYDGVGNRLTEARPTGTTSYTYSAADELTQAGATAYTYDQNGNQLQAGSQPFTYDLANRLKTTTQGATTTTYTYAGDGKRLQASTGTAASAKTNFFWDPNNPVPQVALERNGNNVLQRQYIYGLKRIRQTQGTGTYYLYDGLDSVANTTAPLGALQKTYSYEPFGQIRTESGSSPTNFLHFTGEYRDPTGLYHLRARQYDPASGRFLSRDPLVPSPREPAVGTYIYANDRPTFLIDPSGLRWCRRACDAWDTVSVAVEGVGEFVEENPDAVLGGIAVACFLLAPEASPACAAIATGAALSGVTRSAVENGVIGDRPTNYCRFLLSAGASVTLFGTGSAISLLWKDPYVLSEIDRRILRAGTEYLGSGLGLDYIASAGAAGLCASGSEGTPGSHDGK